MAGEARRYGNSWPEVTRSTIPGFEIGYSTWIWAGECTKDSHDGGTGNIGSDANIETAHAFYNRWQGEDRAQTRRDPSGD
jgi:hypothetical protein